MKLQHKWNTPEEMCEYLSHCPYGACDYSGKIISMEHPEIEELYRTQSPEHFEKIGYVGNCWDYTTFSYWYFQKYFNDLEFSAFYIQLIDEIDMPTHTWLSFKRNGKVYLFETAWKSIAGITEYDNESDMINDYIEKNFDYLKNENPKTKFKGHIVLKFIPPQNGGYNFIEFMEYVITHSKYVAGSRNIIPIYSRATKGDRTAIEYLIRVTSKTEGAILESVKNQYKKDYKRVKAIFDSLSDEEKKFVSPRNEFVDSDKILFREVMQNGKGQDVGFIDVYEFNNNKQIGFIVMAVHPDFRGQGYSRKLRTSAIENCKKLRMSKLIYRVDVSNGDSLRSIKRDKRFVLITKGKTYHSYGIDLDKYEEDVPEDVTAESVVQSIGESFGFTAVNHTREKRDKIVQESFMLNEEGKESEFSMLLSFCDSHNVNLYDSYVVFNEKETKIDKDGWYTDKYGNRKLKGDSYYVGMDTHADEEEWKKKIVFKSFDKNTDQYSHGKPQPNIIIDGKLYRARSEVIVMDGNKILVDKTKNRAGFGYTFPGGGIDPGESFAQNARRECEEEALIIPKRIHYVNIAWMMNYTNGIMNDGAISFVCIAEKGNNFKGKVKAHDKDEFADNAVWMDYRRLDNLAPPHRVAIERFLNGQEFAETTGPAASGPVVGMEKNLVFVSQYGPKNSKAKLVEGYAVSNDMMTKNIIVTDHESGNLMKVPYSYLEGREITMFEVKGKTGGLKKILSEVGKPHTKNFIYEALTGKELLSDDQLFCENNFSQVDIIEMGSEVVSEIQTMFSEFKQTPEFELMNEKLIQEADKLLDGIDDVVILENQHGFFAKNTKTGKRTGYFKRIKDIKVKSVKTK